MTQASGQNAQALFTHLRNGAGFNMTPNQLLADDRDANGSGTNVFASDRQITVTDADVVPALEKVKCVRNRFLGESDQTCAKSTNETLTDLVGVCVALLRFAEMSTYIRIWMKKDAQGAQQFDLDYNEVISHTIQRLHALRLIKGQGSYELINPQASQILRNCDGTMTTDSAAGDVYTNPDHITILLGTTVTKTIETTIIPEIRLVPKNTIILRFSVTRPFLIGLTIFKLQYLTAQSAEHQRRPTLVHVESSNNGNLINLIIERINSTCTKLNVPPSFSIQLLKPELQVTKLKFQPITHDQTTHISTTAIKSSLRTERHKWMINRFTRDFWAKRSYALRYLGLGSNGEHHKGFGDGLLNVKTFIQSHARHKYLIINDWKVFWRDVNSDLYLDTVRMKLDEDYIHEHHHYYDHDHENNHRHNKYRNDRNNFLDHGRVGKRRRVISSEYSGNGQNNED
ncbi:MAG: hypothetical protein EZS28_026773 [Streblomastix strix]|uniref:Uncharacterized protein n=1 Tax=Streblomastix strix TaxID=222440 RepID=A0A5J4V5W9_9EUKA|nr:MAG: hypothetical protein EZS28_026773 [Streblomastix strix]